MWRGLNFLVPRQRLAIGLIIITGIANAIGLSMGYLQFDPLWSGWLLLGIIPAGFALLQWLDRADFLPSLKHLITNLALLLIFSPLGFIFSYLIASQSGAPLDEYLVRFDSILGFDWRAYHAFFLQNIYIRSFSLIFYLLIPILPVICVIALCQKGDYKTAANGVAIMMLSALICIAISALIPTYGAAGYYQPDAEFYKGYHTLIDHEYMQGIIALREGRDEKIRFMLPMAVVAFPSYHACLAVLAVLLSWHISKTWFWWMLALNIAGLLVTPVEGGHHLVDVLAGILVIVITSICIQHLRIEWLCRKTH